VSRGAKEGQAIVHELAERRKSKWLRRGVKSRVRRRVLVCSFLHTGRVGNECRAQCSPALGSLRNGDPSLVQRQVPTKGNLQFLGWLVVSYKTEISHRAFAMGYKHHCSVYR